MSTEPVSPEQYAAMSDELRVVQSELLRAKIKAAQRRRRYFEAKADTYSVMKGALAVKAAAEARNPTSFAVGRARLAECVAELYPNYRAPKVGVMDQRVRPRSERAARNGSLRGRAA
ncbi:hypothetical protein B0G38_002084 [Arthrobacter sp. VKM Ac-2550]|nr:hypothetical protein [Arthrobacter sp. VKM Ac-2550]